MNFISLSDLLESQCAADLYARLHNASEPPRWAVIDPETGRALRDDSGAVAMQGLAILKHKAGQPRRDADEHARHVSACLACGLDPDREPQSHSLADLHKFPFMRETKIGFSRDDLTAFLEPVEGQNAKGIQAQQVTRICKIIEKLGHNPKCLPPNSPGKRGVKFAVRSEYKNTFRDYTVSKFDRAWERMLAE